MWPSIRHRFVSISSEYILNRRSFCSSIIRSTNNNKNNNELLKLEEVEKILNDVRADDIKVIPINNKSEFTNYVVVATGKSQWHVRNIAQALIYKVFLFYFHLFKLFLFFSRIRLKYVIVYIRQKNVVYNFFNYC